MSKKYVVGVDLGGTKILTAIADLEGNIIERVRVETGADEPAEKVVNRINDTVKEVIDKVDLTIDDIAKVGVGSPGPLDIEKGIVLFSPNLKWNNVPIVSLMEEELGLPVLLENDANAAALAEYHFGAGVGTKHMIYMTVSTGIGGGIIVNGEILHGVGSGGGEIGHHTIMPHGPECGCGNHGCLEALASGTALGRYGKEAVLADKETLMKEMVDNPEDVDGATVTQAAEKGDKVAQEIVDQVAEYLGIGIANLINIFNPSKLVLGGGVTKAGHLFYDKIIKTVEKRALEAPRKQCQIVFSDIGSDVGVLGAIAVALS